MSGNKKNKSTTQTADKKWFIVMSLVLVCFAFSPPQAGAVTNWPEKAKLLASDGAAGDHFGQSVSISGDYAIVGAEQFNSSGTGKAYIFKWDGTSWSQQAKIIASDGDVNDYFGGAVSISGDYAIVGAVLDDDKGDDSGSAYIFRRDGTNWVQQSKILASDGTAYDCFGISVSISGDYAIVGVPWDNDKGYASGSAYIFRWDGETWSQQAKLTASDVAADDWFGISVSISGDLAIVGVSEDDSARGSAYIFRWDGTSWSEQAKVLASDGAAGDEFGVSVSISGDLAIVGAYYDNDNGAYSGSAYIFKRDGETWSQQAKILASDGAACNYFGFSVSINGDYAIIGANDDNDNGSSSGSAYIFKRDGTNWSEQAKLLASDGATGDYFGNSVSISGDYAIVGAPYDDDKGENSGSAYIFNKFCPKADLNGDCKVDFTDLAIFADSWLYGTD